MTALLILFAILAGSGALLLLTLLRRGSSRTETAEGLRHEELARRQAQHDRVSFGAAAVHNSVPTASDTYSRRQGRS
ncbi:hypothetical protein [Streptomyces sp. NPDC051180]|uniref:hypothetical protein n=1 Tax=unclassified Streptomyces TaxID=2593676 RepID=UPI00344D213F